MEAINTESRKRNVAYKIKIGDLLKSKPFILDGRFIHLEFQDKKIVRVNLLANCIDKFLSENDKKFGTLTVDDASGQIQIKVFGDDLNLIKDILQGDTLQIVGNIREWNSEIYILPEIVKKTDPRWLLVRKIELQKEKENYPNLTNKNELKDIILNKIKDAEVEGGIDIDTIILNTESSPEKINNEIKRLLEEGIIYEPRPGRIRYLG
ncbi:MAG: OB-fold nucleic acid binding domain-containing protein [Candidatus Pacearchaeota archaeon]